MQDFTRRRADKDPALGAVDQAMLDPNLSTGISAEAKDEEDQLHKDSLDSERGSQSRQGSGSDSQSNKDSKQSQDQGAKEGGAGWTEEEGQWHKDPEVLAVEQLRVRSKEKDYTLNEGEQLVMQVWATANDGVLA